MCRLYSLRANEPTKVECTLVHSQNALMVQSRSDQSGRSHGSGWGVATYEDTLPHVERRAWAAYHGEHFARAAARVYSDCVLAHVRRATVGDVSTANTHPFVHGRWALAHNGTIPGFERVRERMLRDTAEAHREAIAGTTDSEHVFRLFMTMLDREPAAPPARVLAEVFGRILGWCATLAPGEKIGLNLIVTDGEQMLGTRLGRPLSFVEREGLRDCEVCGFPHVHHDPRVDYRAAVIATEPLTNEAWREVPEAHMFVVDDDFRVRTTPLG